MIASLRIVFLALCFCSAGLAAFGQQGDVRTSIVPEAAAEAGLTPVDWIGIRNAYERGRRAAGTVDQSAPHPRDPGSNQAATSGPILQQQAYLKGHNTDIGDFFGRSVSASGDTVVVGAFAQDSPAYDAGAAYVFVRSGTSWIQQAYLKASNPGVVDYFGTSVSVDGDTVAVGAPWEGSRSTGVNGPQSNDLARAGAAYVFVRSGTTWIQQAYLKASNTDRDDWFGMGVSVSGDTVVVGAPREDSSATGVNGDQSNDGATDSGAAYVFVRNGTSWSQQAYLKASNTEAGDQFGGDGDLFYGYFRGSVAVSGDTIVVGALAEDSNANGVNHNQSDNSAMFAGAAYVFVRNGTSWSQQAYLKASNSIAYDLFGQSVSVSHNTVAVGASGAAYVFERSGTTWSEQGRLPPEAFSVSVSGDTVVVGRPHDNGFAGAAYLFVRSGTTWIQQDGVSHPLIWPTENLGFAVSVSADTVAVGAYGAGPGPSSCPPCNPAGAAYVYKVSPLVTYCTGKTTSAGCVPFVSCAGTPNASTGSFLIKGNDHIEGQPGMLIYSTRKSSLDFHGGTLCVGAPFRRLSSLVKATDGLPCGTCAGSCRMFVRDFNQLIRSGTDPMLTLGQAVYVQVRQSDPANLATTGFADNLSDALSFTIGF